MKKIVIAVLLAFLLICAACGRPPEKADGKLSVVATIFPCCDFARQIAGELADVAMLLPLGGESHSFEPTPMDIAKIKGCGVFVCGGGSADAWAEKILASMDTSHMQIVRLTGCVELLEDEHGDIDEHVWTSPRNAMRIVEHISQALCEADPANAPAYRQNAAAYQKKLEALDASLHAVVEHAARRTVIFGGRFPFRYLAQAYGLECFSAFPGCAEETQASAAMVKLLIDKVKAEKIPVVFYPELSDTKMAETIAGAAGAQVRLLHACHNISKDDFLAGKGYLDLMEANVRALGEALGQSKE